MGVMGLVVFEKMLNLELFGTAARSGDGDLAVTIHAQHLGKRRGAGRKPHHAINVLMRERSEMDRLGVFENSPFRFQLPASVLICSTPATMREDATQR